MRLAAGVEMVEELLATPPFTDVVGDAQVADGFGGYAHATSTCAMGSVVDEHGAVIGYDDLFVADASVLPTTPPSGTYVPVLLLAERLAESWLASADAASIARLCQRARRRRHAR